MTVKDVKMVQEARTEVDFFHFPQAQLKSFDLIWPLINVEFTELTSVVLSGHKRITNVHINKLITALR